MARSFPIAGRDFLALVAMAAVAACTGLRTGQPSSDTAMLNAAIAGRVAGAPVPCIDANGAPTPQSIDRRTLIYRQSGRRIWVNHLAQDCPFLRGDPILIVEADGGMLCRGTIFHTLPRLQEGIPSAACVLGDFTPYDRPPRN